MTIATPARLFAILGAVMLLAGCGAVRAHRGSVVDQQLVGALQVGIDNKDSVEKTLGRPTFTGQFTTNEWYYVSRDTSQYAFRDPRVTKQTVTLVKFDKSGNLASIQNYGKEWIFKVKPNGKQTPTLGRKRGFFEELFGNIGTVGASGAPDQ